MNIKTNIRTVTALAVACSVLLGGGCMKSKPPEESNYNKGVENGATAAVNALMERLVKNQSLTITLTDKEIEAIRVEAIKVARIE